MSTRFGEEERLGAFDLLGYLSRLLRFVEGRRFLFVALIGLSVVQSGIELSLPLIVRSGIDRYIMPLQASVEQPAAAPTVTAPETAWTGLSSEEARRGLWLLGGLYLLLLIINFGLNYAVAYGLNYLGQRAVLLMRGQLWKRLLRLPISYFDENPVGRLVTRLTNDSANLVEFFSAVLSSVVGDVVIFIGVLVVLASLDWRATLWLLVLAPPLVLLVWWFKKGSQRLYRTIRVQLARLNTFLQETLSGIQVVRLFVREAQFTRRFHEINNDYYHSQIGIIYLWAIFRPLVEILATGGTALVIWYAGGAVLRQELSVGTLVAFLLYIRMLFTPLLDLSEKFNILQSALTSSERLFKILDTPEEPSGITVHTPATGPLDITFENVTFGYKPDQSVLHQVSFHLPAGGKVALVGPSGSGKTTIAALVLRLYPLAPGSGRILVGGVPVEQWDVQELRRRFALVQQDLFLYRGTLQDNLTLFAPCPAERLTRALSVSRVDRLVARLSGGLEHALNERGASLSQGERQLLSFGRALACGGQMVILDEATSAIDSVTEELIQAALADLLRDRSALLIAHRLSTIQAADNILVLHGGRIVEQGTHAQLIVLDGLYARMYRAQRMA